MKMVWFCGIILAGFVVSGIFCSCANLMIINYGIRFRNIGDQNLYVYDAFIEERVVPCGVLIKGGNADSVFYRKIPDSIKIKWRKDNGSVVERNVKVKENLPSRFGNNDTIVFNITDNDEVILSFKRWGDKEIDSNGNEVNYKK